VKVGIAIREVAAAEEALADALWDVGERHRTDHDVFHVTKTLAKLERKHIGALRPHAERLGETIDADAATGEARGVLERVVEKGAELVGRRPEPGLLLLRDLRLLHELAARASIEWVILAQGAQAVKDADLLSVVSEGHAETLRTLKWTTYRIKTAAPQILAT
jgi:hypothetical protein